MTSPSPAARIRILLVDDHPMVRRGLRDFLGLHPDLEVVGEAATGLEAVEVATAICPDVVIMNLLLPGIDGIEATARVKAARPEVQVVALTSDVDDDRVIAALEAGATGFLLKHAAADEVATAIRSAAGGDVYLDPSAAGIVARRVAAKAARAGDPTGTDRLAALTPREREVLALVARGRSNRRIAVELAITERTARTHVSNILAKLALASRTQAALLAAERGLGRES